MGIRTYTTGDVLGKRFEIQRVLGVGGCGIVYLALWREYDALVAIKTVQSSEAVEAESAGRFRREASLWADLDPHSNVVRVYGIFDFDGQLGIVMEYVANEHGLSSLQDHLDVEPPDLRQALRWAIDVCHGLEHAYGHDVRVHRDLKPANILITDKNKAKVSDLGLAGIIRTLHEPVFLSDGRSDPHKTDLAHTVAGAAFGTVTHMPPEQFANAASCDEHSDIYSLGIILYQLATGGALPFLAPMPQDLSEPRAYEAWFASMWALHAHAPVPQTNSPLSPIIGRCLEKAPPHRYRTVATLRGDLERLLTAAGKAVAPVIRRQMQPIEWCNRGASLAALGRDGEALDCYRKAIQLDPSLGKPWHNMAHLLCEQQQFEEALRCLDRAVELAPTVETWNDKGIVLQGLRRFDEALGCFDAAIQLNPELSVPWRNRGCLLDSLDRRGEAEACFRSALARDPLDSTTWVRLGNLLGREERLPEAASCFRRLTEIDPDNAEAWKMLAISLENSNQFADAIACHQRSLALNKDDAGTWYALGVAQQRAGLIEDAEVSLQRCVALDPLHARAWTNLGGHLAELGRPADGLQCLDRAVQLQADDPIAWWHKAECERELGRTGEAVASLRQVLALAHLAPHGLAAMADQRVRELQMQH